MLSESSTMIGRCDRTVSRCDETRTGSTQHDGDRREHERPQRHQPRPPRGRQLSLLPAGEPPEQDEHGHDRRRQREGHPPARQFRQLEARALARRHGAGRPRLDAQEDLPDPAHDVPPG